MITIILLTVKAISGPNCATSHVTAKHYGHRCDAPSDKGVCVGPTIDLHTVPLYPAPLASKKTPGLTSNSGPVALFKQPEGSSLLESKPSNSTVVSKFMNKPSVSNNLCRLEEDERFMSEYREAFAKLNKHSESDHDGLSTHVGRH